MSARDELARLVRDEIKKYPVDTSLPAGLQPGPAWGATEWTIADAILAAGWRPPARVVTTVQEIEALPEGAILLDPTYTVWFRSDLGRRAEVTAAGPFTVIHEPVVPS
ncbi:hypothetical protein [Streptomyces sp.]|uniref:hypothetical protein n=1 Tax=Streptomyces sp. TaxID=1931 RepID=UPI002F921BB3